MAKCLLLPTRGTACTVRVPLDNLLGDWYGARETRDIKQWQIWSSRCGTLTVTVRLTHEFPRASDMPVNPYVPWARGNVRANVFVEGAGRTWNGTPSFSPRVLPIDFDRLASPIEMIALVHTYNEFLAADAAAMAKIQAVPAEDPDRLERIKTVLQGPETTEMFSRLEDLSDFEWIDPYRLLKASDIVRFMTNPLL